MILREDAFLGINYQPFAYATAEIVILWGKDEQQKKELLNSVQHVMEEHFVSDNKTSITSRLTIVEAQSYVKKFIL